MNSLGEHILLEFYGCPSSVIVDSDRVEKILTEAAKIAKAHIIETVFHKFNPHGISGVIIIAESHFSIHTWPEYNYAAIDLFSCSKNIDLKSTIKYLKKELQPKSVSILEFNRGIFD